MLSALCQTIRCLSRCGVQIVAFVDAMWLAIIVDFCAVQSYWAMNEVARDLEDPFVYDPNDLPLARYQVQSPNKL